MSPSSDFLNASEAKRACWWIFSHSGLSVCREGVITIVGVIENFSPQEPLHTPYFSKPKRSPLPHENTLRREKTHLPKKDSPKSLSQRLKRNSRRDIRHAMSSALKLVKKKFQQR